MLPQPDIGIINESTGEPYAASTIAGDCDAILQEWQDERFENTELLVSRTFAELEEVKRVGWQRRELQHVLSALKQQRDLLGLDKPKNINVSTDMRVRIEMLATMFDVSPDELETEMQGILKEIAP